MEIIKTAVIVTFKDGETRDISDSIDYKTWRRIDDICESLEEEKGE